MPQRSGPRWAVSFQSSDTLRARERAAAAAEDEGEPCARGDWCSGRSVEFIDGERIIRPARTYTSYCPGCQAYLTRCLIELGVRYPAEGPADDTRSLYQRLGDAIGDPVQAQVRVHSPFGPQVPLREDVDALLRLIGVLVPGWAIRVRAAAQLHRPDLEGERPDTMEAIASACDTLATHPSVLFGLQPAWMTRAFPLPLNDDLAESLADHEIVRMGEGYIAVMVLVGPREAGEEIQRLHYRARSVLLETNPPLEILIPPCRGCELRALRRAWPEAGSDADVYSRCDNCLDVMSAEEYDVNARRWGAYYKAHADRPVLADAS